MNNDSNVKPLRPSSERVDGGGPNGGNGRLRAIEERLTRIEEQFGAQLEHLATGKDVAEVKTLISEKESSMTKWLIGTLLGILVAVAGASVAVALALLRIFMD